MTYMYNLKGAPSVELMAIPSLKSAGKAYQISTGNPLWRKK